MSSFLKGLAAGAMLGAIAGILFAPKSGRETRHHLKHKFWEIKNKFSDKLSQMRRINKERYSQTLNEILDRSEMPEDEKEQLKDELLSKYNRIKNVFEE